MTDNSVKITAMIVFGVLIFALIGAYIFFESNPTKETIAALGLSTITVVPDLVSVYFNVETNETTAKEAKDANSEIIDAMTVALIKEGFEESQIETVNFNVYEDFEYVYDRYTSKSISKGFKAIHSVRVKFSTKNSDKIGEVIDAGIDSGAMLSYINFELSQELENKNKAEALRLATEDARVKAEAIADGLGAELGKVVSVSTSDYRYAPFMAYDNTGSATLAVKSAEIETSINPSDQEISAQVSVVYKLN